MFYNECFSISELSEQLNYKIKTEFNEFEEIILVGHSMGGIIARKSIINHFNPNVKKLILYASPINGSNAANFLNYFTKKNVQLNDLKNNSELFNELNSEWKKSGNIKNLKVINVATPFDQYTSIKNLMAYWNTKHDELHILKNKLHFSIIFPRSSHDKAYEILKKAIID